MSKAVLSLPWSDRHVFDVEGPTLSGEGKLLPLVLLLRNMSMQDCILIVIPPTVLLHGSMFSVGNWPTP